MHHRRSPLPLAAATLLALACGGPSERTQAPSAARSDAAPSGAQQPDVATVLRAAQAAIEATAALSFDLAVYGTGLQTPSVEPMAGAVIVVPAAPGRPARLHLDGTIGAEGAGTATEPISVASDGQLVAMVQPALRRHRHADLMRNGSLLLANATRRNLQFVLDEGYLTDFLGDHLRQVGDSVVDGVACQVVQADFEGGGGRRWHLAKTDRLPRREERWDQGDGATGGALTTDFKNLRPLPDPPAETFTLAVPDGFASTAWVPAGPAPGDPAPDFTLRTADGAEIALAALRGQVVVLDFWATWCGPCQASAPALAALHRELGASGVAFIGATWQESGDPLAFARQHHLDYPIAPGDTIAEAYGITAAYGVPTLFVIDPAGRIADFTVGYLGEPTDAWLRRAIARARSR